MISASLRSTASSNRASITAGGVTVPVGVLGVTSRIARVRGVIRAAMAAGAGNIYYGLWYPVVVAVMSLVIGTLFLSETKERDIRVYDHSMLP